MPDESVMQPDWLSLLRAEVSKPGKSVTSVAAEIGMPRPSLSLLLNGKYPAGIDKKAAKFESKVLHLYTDQLVCPHLGSAIGRDVCNSFASRPMTTSSPEKLRQFMACRDCTQNPNSTAQDGSSTKGI